MPGNKSMYTDLSKAVGHPMNGDANHRMPKLGLGTFKATDDTCVEAVYHAIAVAGYRLIDTAAMYLNEESVGKGIKRAIDEGVCKREDLVVVSKLWPTDAHPEHIENACRKSVEKLGVGYLDLYLHHWPLSIEHHEIPGFYKDANGMVPAAKVSRQTIWQCMETCVDKGLTKTIGISNYTPLCVSDLWTYCRIPPAALQLELHPFYQRQRPLEAIRKFFPDIVIMGYCPLARGNYPEGHLLRKLAAKHNTTPFAVC
eukprot:Clim_evm7s205 gene=Clim_evmTU7s205